MRRRLLKACIVCRRHTVYLRSEHHSKSQCKKYWQPDFEPRNIGAKTIGRRICDQNCGSAVTAVDSERRSNRLLPVGRLDSSSIVGLLAELGYPKIKTYSLGFVGEEEESWNEIDLARQVARRWGTEHHEIVLKPEELLSDLVSMVWHLDEPYGGGLPSWYVFREMSKDVKVGLTGTGGDELFGNYGKFRVYENQRLIAASMALRQRSQAGSDLLASLASPMASLANHLPSSLPWIGRGRLLSELPKAISQPFGRYYYANSEYFSDDFKREHVLRTQNGGLQDTASYLQNHTIVVEYERAKWFGNCGFPHSISRRIPFHDRSFLNGP